MTSVRWLVSLVIVVVVGVASGQDDRLPGESQPSYQSIDLTVYQENEGERNFTFEGEAHIDVQMVRDTAQIVLHAAVNVSSVAVTHYLGGDIASSYEQPQDGRDFLVISLQEQVVAGSTLTLDISFAGDIGYRQPGFFRSEYQDWDGLSFIYATQLKPNYARRVFPCYDEPAVKVRYQLNIRTRPYLNYGSNTQSSADDGKDSEGFYNFHFGETPPISAYQLSWVLGEMGYMAADDIDVLFWDTHLSFQQVFARNMAPVAVDVMEQLVGVPSPNEDIGKLDHFAIPGYIEQAVGNLGIITYSDSSMLVDDDYTSEATKERVLSIIQREEAHQWFDGLVTPRWWNDLWLSEGFSSYFQWIAAALVQPTWQLREVFVVNSLLQTAMPADVGPNNYPLSKSLNVSAEQAFNGYLYEKGASIVWMMENVIGSEAFYRGLNKYLTENQYLDVWEDLLFAALDSETPASSLPEGASLSSVIRPWLHQPGFPLISVSRNYSDGSALISQAPYLSQEDIVWPVPVSYTSHSEANFSASPSRLWLLDSEVAVAAMAAPDDWLLLNVNLSGYYRVNYDEQNWELLTQQMLRDPDLLPAVARAQLLDDAANLAAVAHLLPASVALRLASFLRLEYSYILWRAVPGVLQNLQLLVDDDAAEDFREFALSLIQHMVILLHYHEQPGEDHLTRILRGIVVSIACNYGEPECLSSMYDQLQNLMADPENYLVDPDLKRSVYCYGAQQGGEAAYQFLRDLYHSTDVISELDDIVQGATCSQLVDGLRLLELTAAGAEGGFRREQLLSLLEGLLQRRHGLPAALQFLSHGAHLLSWPHERQTARKLLRQATMQMRDEHLLEKVEHAAVALEDESLLAVAQWRCDVIARGAAARRDAARWLKDRPWRL